MTAHEIGRGHALFPFELNFAQTQRTSAARDHDAVFERDLSWRSPVRDNCRGVDLQLSLGAALLAQNRERPGPRIERADSALKHLRRFRPINLAMFALE